MIASLPEILPFEVNYGAWSLKGDSYPGAITNNVLYLHGAGTSSRSGYTLPRQTLQAHGVGTTCFDCVGHGDTAGELRHSSLASRTKQAEAIIVARKLDEPLVIFGTSMGAYNAIKLTQCRQVEALVLIVPGIYTPEAYEVPFGPAFSTIIRRDRSWMQSDAWDILRDFKGRLLVMAAEHDHVIPLEIPERLVASANNASWAKLYVAPDATHNLFFSRMLQQPPLFDEAMAHILDCILPALVQLSAP